MSKESEILIRKQKIWSLYKQAITQQQIADKLDVNIKTISRDFQELKQESKEWMETLPDGEIQLLHKKNFDMIDKVLQELWNIFETTKDDNKKIRILNIIAQKCKMHVDMMGANRLFEVRSRLAWYSDSTSNTSSLSQNIFKKYGL